MTPEIRAASEFAMHVILPDGEVRRGGRSVLTIFGTLGWPLMGLLACPPFIWAIELGYWFVAKNRMLASRLFFTVDHDSSD